MRALMVKHIASLPADALAALLADAEAARNEWEAGIAKHAASTTAAMEKGRLTHQSVEESAPVGGHRQEAPPEQEEDDGMSPEQRHDFKVYW